MKRQFSKFAAAVAALVSLAAPGEGNSPPMIAARVAVVVDRTNRKLGLEERIERTARAVFEEVVIVETADDPAAAGLSTLAVRAVGVANPFPRRDESTRPSEARVYREWSLADPQGCIFWAETVSGDGTASWSAGFLVALKKAEEAAALAAQREIRESAEVRRHFAMRKEAASTAGDCGPELRRMAPPA